MESICCYAGTSGGLMKEVRKDRTKQRDEGRREAGTETDTNRKTVTERKSERALSVLEGHVECSSWDSLWLDRKRVKF